MSKTKTAATGHTTVANVVSIAPHGIARVDPEPGWELRNQWGFMSFDDTEAGRVVRLADVFHWLCKGMLEATALQKLLAGLQDVAPSAGLYLVQKGEHAMPVGPFTLIFKKVPESGPARIFKVDQGMTDLHEDCFGIEAVRWVVERQWSSWPKDAGKSEPLSRVAIPILKANELWGWGTAERIAPPAAVATTEGTPPAWADVKAYRKSAATSVEWSAEHIASLHVQRDSLKAANHGSARGVVSALSKDLGISNAAVNNQLKKQVKWDKAKGAWQFVEPGKREVSQGTRSRAS